MGVLREEIVLEILFDSNGYLCGQRVQADGDPISISARYRSLFEHAFRMQASGLVLVHNHPSGNPRPSAQDIAATRRLAAVARAMDIEFHDHVVIGGKHAVSMKRARLMP
ncbi:JAB domain-containing protein [Novosphingobium sp. 2580]|uniref:JAB domain-containing protein n=2 Tax=Novosphingobium album (ex Hu et al. 2023) TaxID=2930093 RepID=A0ABT0AZ95_9SPHN|nr:JAB domain-containing protein [Novosphingobium album (ex Hu et al. 2023)]